MAKLPDTRKLQHVYCTKFDDTFNFNAWYWKNWYRLFTPLIPHDMFPGQHCISLHFRNSFVGLQYYTENDLSPHQQGARKVIFKACHSGKLKLANTSPNVISTSPKNISMSRIDFTVLLYIEFLKKFHLPIGQVKNKIPSPDSKIKVLVFFSSILVNAQTVINV